MKEYLLDPSSVSAANAALGSLASAISEHKEYVNSLRGNLGSAPFTYEGFVSDGEEKSRLEQALKLADEKITTIATNLEKTKTGVADVSDTTAELVERAREIDEKAMREAEKVSI